MVLNPKDGNNPPCFFTPFFQEDRLPSTFYYSLPIKNLLLTFFLEHANIIDIKGAVDRRLVRSELVAKITSV